MGAQAIFQLTTPWTSDEMSEVGYEQTADLVYFTHLDHDPYVLKRYDHAVWTLEVTAYGATTTPPTDVLATAVTPNTGTGYTPTTQTYVVTGINTISGQESLQAGPSSCFNDLGLDGNHNIITWTASADCDRYSVYKEVSGVYGYVGGSAGLSFTDDNIQADLSDTPPQDRTPFSGTYDKPAVVSFYDGRAVYGRTKNSPNAGFASQSDDFQNFNVARPAKASDAISFKLVGKQVNTIQHLVPLKVLLALTDTSIFAIDGQGGYITPSDVRRKIQGYSGSSRVRPVTLEEIAFYNTAKGSRIRTIGYQFDRDGYKGNDITVFAPHLFRTTSVIAMFWSEYPMSVLWAVRNDGKFLALTWQAEQDVWGWSLCETAGIVESGCVIPENGQDVTYLEVARVIDGQTVRFMERMGSPLYGDDIQDGIFADCSRAYDGDPRTVFSGLDYLEGCTVCVLADGAVVSDKVVVNGRVTLATAASRVRIGLPFESWIHTLPVVGSGQKGSTRGKAAIAGRVIVDVEATRGIEVAAGRRLGPSDPDTSDTSGFVFDELKTRDGEPYGQAPYAYTGSLQADLEAGDWSEATVVIRQRYPLPMKILGVAPDVEMGDE